MTQKPWPYPFWIAHRGAGTLAPENTLAAFRLGAAYGYRMFECDAKLSADDRVFLLHDTTLERTSNGQGIAGQMPWKELIVLDAGSWHSPAFTAEPLCTLSDLAQFCVMHGHALNIEIKPTPGRAYDTGQKVAQAAAQLWLNQALQPLLSSFETLALEGAKDAVPHLPRALLIDSLWPNWWDAAQTLECCAVVANHTLWNAQAVRQVQSAGMRCLSYTVNDVTDAKRLQALGTDGIITDRIDLFPAEK